MAMVKKLSLRKKSGPPVVATPLVGRRERNKQEKLARIVRAARRLFAEKGFAATTTREIADQADVASGTLFLYCKTKEELLVLIFREEVGQVIDEAFATVRDTQPLLDQLLHVFNAVIAHHNHDKGLARIFVKELPFVDEPLREDMGTFMTHWYERLAGLIERTQRRGELRTDVPALLLARNCFVLFFAQLRQWLGGRVPRDKLTERLQQSLELQLCGLRRGSAVSQSLKTLAARTHKDGTLRESA